MLGANQFSALQVHGGLADTDEPDPPAKQAKGDGAFAKEAKVVKDPPKMLSKDSKGKGARPLGKKTHRVRQAKEAPSVMAVVSTMVAIAGVVTAALTTAPITDPVIDWHLDSFMQKEGFQMSHEGSQVWESEYDQDWTTTFHEVAGAVSYTHLTLPTNREV